MASLPQQIARLEEENSLLKKRLDVLEKELKGVKGQPLIQGYVGQKLTLNASLNVIEFLKRIATAEAAANSVSASGLTALVSGLSANNVPRYDGSAFVTGAISDSGIAVSISLPTTISDTLTTSGRRRSTTRVTTSSYTVLSADDIIVCDTDGNAITVNLPAGTDGRDLRIENVGSAGNDVTVTPNGTELLDGFNISKTLSDGSIVDLSYETTEGWR